MSEERDTSKPLTISLVLLGVALLFALVGGFGRGSILAALVAAIAAVPAGYATWLGMQSHTQAKTAYGMLLMLGALGLAGLQVVLRLVSWLR